MEELLRRWIQIVDTKSVINEKRYTDQYEEAKDPQKAHNFKYIVWKPINAGWGNIFSDYASGIAFGLITNRLIYLDSRNYDGLLDSAVPAWQDWNKQKALVIFEEF